VVAESAHLALSSTGLDTQQAGPDGSRAWLVRQAPVMSFAPRAAPCVRMQKGGHACLSLSVRLLVILAQGLYLATEAEETFGEAP
jgi:hypothetical protein